jgi:hypothetical protein
MRTILPASEIVRRGRELYEQGIRAKVEAGNHGRILVVDILTGDYEIADDAVTASNQATHKNPDAVLFYMRIGFPAAYRIGRSTTTERA